MASITKVPLELIQVPGDRQRKHFPQEDHDKLVASIIDDGLIQPILLRPDEATGLYHLVAGERRFRAIIDLDRPYKCGNDMYSADEVPAIVRSFEDEQEVARVELAENIHRLQLTWPERAQAIAAIHKNFLDQGLSESQAKKETGLLLDDEPDRARPKTVTRQEVAQAILLAGRLDDPEISKAKTADEALKRVTRGIEDDFARQLGERRPDPVGAEQIPGARQALASLLGSVVEKAVSSHIFHRGSFIDSLHNIDPNSIRVLCTDPPWGVGADKFKSYGNIGTTGQHRYEDTAEHAMELHDQLFSRLDTVMASAAHIYLFISLPRFELFSDKLTDLGWRVRSRPLIWYKPGSGALVDGLPTGWRSSSEYILCASRGSYPWKSTKDDVLAIEVVRKKHHAAQKPARLYRALLEQSCVPGDWVWDPFAGSGTIFEAASELRVKAIGSEIDSDMFEVCEAKAAGKTPSWEPDF